MTAQLLDGKALAATIKADLTVRVQALLAQGITPGLGTVLVGDDPGSKAYVAGKHRDCAQVGIASLQVELPASVSEAKMPRRSFEHIARQARPSSSSRATTREQVLWVRWTVSASSLIRTFPCGHSPSRSSTSNSTAIRVIAIGWQSGTSSAVRLAPWIAATRAIPITSPFFAPPDSMSISVSGRIRIVPPARATRCVSAFAETSTMCAWPSASKWVSSLIGRARGTKRTGNDSDA